ncbi:membrane protein containing YeeE/YedE domain [Christiangramia forsetii KT0803]|uniref:Membrane protein containing YeeE/YedE domain n=3 Tax=Christiangramia forsetii TaxID=411153 RepID=A0M0V0_CHRFK|nr:transporter [Christiangramia forsetii]CAL66245.1 membrane protein containing YeeE/YedE domain [Christiangramia forsetii KT0803]
MMKYITYILIGFFFGIIMYKSEAASWFRIYEMFEFGSFHMYGIIGSALILGILGVQFIKRNNIKAMGGGEMQLKPKNKSVPRYLIGGIIFGLGWALAGACPGPMYVLAGSGYISILIVIAAALLGTFMYGLLRNRLPH